MAAYGMMGASPGGVMNGNVTPPFGGGLTLGAGGAPSPAAPPPAPAPSPASSPAPIFPTGGVNPAEFALGGGGGMMRTPPPAFTPDPSILSRAGAASTPFGFGSPNPYAEFFGGRGGGRGSLEGFDNAQLMAELMAGTPTQPKPPPSVPINPVSIPPVTFS